MSNASWLDLKERVKQATDIVELVGGYAQLRREGRGYKALCPWHDDSRPSLQVNPERQSFKCWVCDIGGDVFTFIERIEGVEFREALAMLAERAGIPLTLAPQRRAEAGEAGSPEPDLTDKRLLYRAMDWAAEQYHGLLLHAPQAAPARAYLAERGISAQSIETFKLGYAPDEWEWLVPAAAGTAFSPAVLERVGLIVRRRNGPGYYDRFRGRVLFPIADPQGRYVALGGRVLPGAGDDSGAKYINSPETPLFTKSRLLYGLHVARDAIRREHAALVMEGYTDCIAAHQEGILHAVAVLGTALGPDHIQLLRRFADRLRIVSVLDGDEAGRRRANEVLELFVAASADLRVLTLPDEADPCEFLQAHGADAFRQLVHGASDALEHAFRTATSGIDLHRDLHQAAVALDHLLATIARAPRLRGDTQLDERLREEKFLQRLAFEFRVPEERLRARLTQLRQKRSAPGPAAAEAAASTPEQLDPLELELLEILVHYPQAMGELAAAIVPERLASPSCRRIFARCLQWFAGGQAFDFERLLLEFDDRWVKNLIIAADERGREKQGSEFEMRFRDLLTQFQRRQDDELRRAQTAALQERTLDHDQGLALLRQIEQLARTRQGISSPTDG